MSYTKPEVLAQNKTQNKNDPTSWAPLWVVTGNLFCVFFSD